MSGARESRLGATLLRVLTTTVLIILCYATYAVVKMASTAEEAQKALDAGKRLKEAGQYAEAIPLIERALELWEAVLDEPHPKVADCLDLLGDLHVRLANHTPAKPSSARALESQKSPQWHNARAEALHVRALRIREAAIGKSHPEVVASINRLANLYYCQGRYARAEPLYVRALKIREAAFGENHPEVASSLQNLGLTYSAQGLYARAESLQVRALKIREAVFDENHPQVASSLHSLATLYTAQGLYARAESLYVRALKIQEAALGEKHPAVAKSLHSLANLYTAQGLYARAEPLQVRALKIREAAFDGNPAVAISLHGLATLYAAQGLYARAEPLYVRALEIDEATLGENHPYVAVSLHDLATLYTAQGLYARAEPLHVRALAIREAAYGESHPSVASSLHDLALLRLAQQHLDMALPLFERSFAASEAFLRQEVFNFSEEHLASILHLLRTRVERIYTLARAYPHDARVRQLALSTALLRKGRSVQEVANTSRIIFGNLNPTERETFERLRSLRTQLATLSLAGPGDLSPTDYQQRLENLSAEGDALEADLAKRSEQFRRVHALPPPAEIVSRVTAALPSDGALIEFVAYRESPLIPEPGISPSEAPNQLRYLALLLFADGRTQAIDLGLAETVDRASLRLRDALARQSLSYLPAAQALYALAFRPLLPHLGKVRQLFIAPDGQLNLVPFAALHDGDRFLVDAFDITYLTSGKDLLPRSASLPSSRSMAIMADPDFGSPLASAYRQVQVAPDLTEPADSLERFFSRLRLERADLPWRPLPGTRKEAQAIHRLFPQAQLLVGPDATKQALLKLSAPSVLHIATHGFFLEDAPPSPASRAVGEFGAIGAGPKEHPADALLRSGLVLAGVHSSVAPPGTHRLEDSVVTALELAGLNLWGTQLVVLSACDTGRGDVKLGEGVYGLRRAFLVAGAETLVASLWTVDDETTSQLMEGYYRKLLAGHGRTTALREAMLELRHKYPHPRFWAPFIALGQNDPLQELPSMIRPSQGDAQEQAPPETGIPR